MDFYDFILNTILHQTGGSASARKRQTKLQIMVRIAPAHIQQSVGPEPSMVGPGKITIGNVSDLVGNLLDHPTLFSIQKNLRIFFLRLEIIRQLV